MDQSRYVVQFDGLSIPIDDVCTYDPDSSYLQDFHTEKEASSKEDKFKMRLNKEENVLNEGFRMWCENKYLEEADVYRDTVYDCSLNRSSHTVTPHVHVVNLSEGSEHGESVAIGYSIEENRYEILTNATKNTGYSCRIDPSVFELKDIDYIRAKCRWNFRNVTDFETNPKIIEHMRYLDLFTQCFSLRFVNERPLDSDADCDTSYRFQNSGIDHSNIQVVCTDHNFSYSGMFKCIPEKECGGQAQQNPNANPQFNENHPDQPKLLYSKRPDHYLCESYLKKTRGSQPVLEKQMDITKRKKIMFSHEPIHVDFKREKIVERKGCTATLERDSTVNEPVNKNVVFTSGDTGMESKVRNMESNVRNVESKMKLKKDYAEENTSNKNADMSYSADFTNANKLKLDNNTIKSIPASSDMNKNLGTKKELRVKSVRYRASARYESSTQSEFISSNSIYETQLDEKRANYFYKRKPSGNPKRAKRIASREMRHPRTLDANHLSLGVNDKFKESSRSLLAQFIKHSRIQNKNLDGNYSETSESLTPSNISSSTYILNSELERNMNEVKEDKHRPIIIIGLNCAEDKLHNKSEDIKAKARICRYIEGDNLCTPGRYALSISKNELNELALGDNVSKLAYKSYLPSIKSQLIRTKFDQLKVNQHPLKRIGTDVESNGSSNIANRSLTKNLNDSSSSVSLESSSKIYKKSNRSKCRKCKTIDTALVNVSNKHHNIFNSNKTSTPNLYVACWKRFCVIL